MPLPPPAGAEPVRFALIGAGRIGTFHATTIARRLPEAELVTVADPAAGAAERLAVPLGAEATTDVDAVLADERVEAVAITCSSTAHAELVTRAAAAGKAVFCEKPMAMTLDEADVAIAACARAGVPLQVGFNRRFAADFAAAKRIVDDGGVGTPQLLRSLTRDPGLANPGAVAPWTIFTQTLIHDFDTLNWFNAGATAVEVHAMADALVAPDFKADGLLDTAVVSIRYDNGALATAEASFSAAYGYDVRGEVFGSAGMVTAGTPAQLTVRHWSSTGVAGPTVRADTELFPDAYAAELAAFCATVRRGGAPEVGGHDARAALRIALACIASVERGAPVRISESEESA
ncbi:Gfo/Idh/MocA family oxidoreductase [Planosporangium thailandense]|uniref:Gfo/Idh/MocA family oxidoreductase n=1 Tax=Planosporangium thailandense TaxID=765197 RepID=A0ABX0XZJ2_9ACTN|nr:Gfo/Idh/MocA family oxidoreductase [Planosporangium thailandense]NJC70579.1 Gfo/Idh/MocA family oxidoreductase [Planosporangium thailandense]